MRFFLWQSERFWKLVDWVAAKVDRFLDRLDSMIDENEKEQVTEKPLPR